MPPKKAPKPTDAGEIAWTIRMPAALAERIKERAVELTEQTGGYWSGNRVIVKALEAAAKDWK